MKETYAMFLNTQRATFINYILCTPWEFPSSEAKTFWLPQMVSCCLDDNPYTSQPHLEMDQDKKGYTLTKCFPKMISIIVSSSYSAGVCTFFESICFLYNIFYWYSVLSHKRTVIYNRNIWCQFTFLSSKYKEIKFIKHVVKWKFP